MLLGRLIAELRASAESQTRRALELDRADGERETERIIISMARDGTAAVQTSVPAKSACRSPRGCGKGRG